MFILAVDGRGAFETSTPAGAITLVVAVAAAILMVWLRTSTRPSRPRPGAPTIDLRPETPAVVDLLTGGFEVEDDAMPATVVDLAARRWFTIDDIGGERIVLRLRQRDVDDELTSYEQRVMTHIRKHAVDGVVPAPVLTLGPQGVSERWFKGFRREVTAHARELGLCHRRWDLRHLVMAWAAVALAFAPAVAVSSAADRTDDPTGWGSPGNLLLGLAFGVALVLLWYAQRISRSDAQVDTPDGLAAASHWMGVRTFYRDSGRFEDKPAASVAVWERTLAYATAMGLAPLVQRQIPFETEHDRHAWSLAAGHWRRVKVSYTAVRPGWGSSPWSVAFSALLQTAFYGFVAYGGFYVASNEIEIDALTISDDQRRLIGLGGLVVAVVAAMACLFAFGKLLLGLSDLFARRTVEGELVRRRELQSGHRLPGPLQTVVYSGRDQHGVSKQDRRRRRWYLAIDTGEHERIRAYRVGSNIYGQVRQGARVRAVVTPRLGYVSRIETLAPPRASAADEPASEHPLAAETVDRALSGLMGKLGVGAGAGTGTPAAMARIETMTGPDGAPVLDQVDDEGVTLRQRLADSRGQLDRLRADPTVASTPLLGRLLDNLTGDGRPDPDPPDATGADEPVDRPLPPPAGV